MSEPMKRFYALQTGATPPATPSMGEITRPTPVIEAKSRVINFAHLGALALVEPVPYASAVSLPAASEPHPTAMNRVLQTPMNRKEFLVTAVGVGLMGLSVKSLIERRLQRQFPNPVSASQAFGAGPYGG